MTKRILFFLHNDLRVFKITQTKIRKKKFEYKSYFPLTWDFCSISVVVVYFQDKVLLYAAQVSLKLTEILLSQYVQCENNKWYVPLHSVLLRIWQYNTLFLPYNFHKKSYEITGKNLVCIKPLYSLGVRGVRRPFCSPGWPWTQYSRRTLNSWTSSCLNFSKCMDYMCQSLYLALILLFFPPYPSFKTVIYIIITNIMRTIKIRHFRILNVKHI